MHVLHSCTGRHMSFLKTGMMQAMEHFAMYMSSLNNTSMFPGNAYSYIFLVPVYNVAPLPAVLINLVWMKY